MGYSKVIQSGSQVELYEFERELPNTGGNRAGKTKRDIYDFTPVIRRKDNVQRQKKSFIRLVRANLVGAHAPVLVTLTMREIVLSARAQHLFNVFVTKLRKHVGKTFRYISVLEFQKRGAVHFHILFWDLPENIVEHERRTRYIASIWGHGFVDIQRTDGSVKLAGYLGKYMAKSLSDKRLGGRRAYNASRNAKRPFSLRGSLYRAYAKVLSGVDDLSTFEPVHSRVFNTQWLGECVYKVYEIN